VSQHTSSGAQVVASPSKQVPSGTQVPSPGGVEGVSQHISLGLHSRPSGKVQVLSGRHVPSPGGVSSVSQHTQPSGQPASSPNRHIPATHLPRPSSVGQHTWPSGHPWEVPGVQPLVSGTHMPCPSGKVSMAMHLWPSGHDESSSSIQVSITTPPVLQANKTAVSRPNPKPKLKQGGHHSEALAFASVGIFLCREIFFGIRNFLTSAKPARTP